MSGNFNMTEEVEDTELHSTLEVADHHSIVGGLQTDRDHATSAPECDEAASAPQAVSNPEQKIPIDDSWPEAIQKSKNELKAVDESDAHSKSHLFGLPRKATIFILIILIIVVLAAAGVGVGIGLGVRNKKTSSTSTQTNVTSTSSPSSQTSVISESNHLIQSDSSLTALGLDHGDRTLVFQDRKGTVRQAIYKISIQTWMAPSTIITSAPKNSTPLAMIHNPTAVNDAIHLFYVDTSNNLASVVYDALNGSWSDHAELVDSRGLPFRASESSRNLQAQRIGVSTPASLQVLIHYENADGNVTILEGSNIPPSGAWALQDITSKLNSSLQPQGFLKAPFTSLRLGNAVRLISTEQTGANLSENSTVITADYLDGKFNSTSDSNTFDPISVGESEIRLASNASQVYGFWVNGTRLASFNTNHSSPNLPTMSIPNSTFPYVRLASINPNPGHYYYLYNQIGPDVLVENQWSYDSGTWKQSSINITEL